MREYDHESSRLTAASDLIHHAVFAATGTTAYHMLSGPSERRGG